MLRTVRKLLYSHLIYFISWFSYSLRYAGDRDRFFSLLLWISYLSSHTFWWFCDSFACLCTCFVLSLIVFPTLCASSLWSFSVYLVHIGCVSLLSSVFDFLVRFWYVNCRNQGWTLWRNNTKDSQTEQLKHTIVKRADISLALAGAVSPSSCRGQQWR